MDTVKYSYIISLKGTLNSEMLQSRIPQRLAS